MLLLYEAIPSRHFLTNFGQIKSLAMPHALKLSSPTLIKAVSSVFFPHHDLQNLIQTLSLFTTVGCMGHSYLRMIPECRQKD